MSMMGDARADANVRTVVPFLSLADMQRSLRYYVDGLGFSIKQEWVIDGKVRWCWLERGDAALMLQEFPRERRDTWGPQGKVGAGVSLWFICDDTLAMYAEICSRTIDCSEPQVGNGMCVITLSDPDGYHLNFESPTDTPEGAKLSDLK
jgi:lactoylglutathione lyase